MQYLKRINCANSTHIVCMPVIVLHSIGTEPVMLLSLKCLVQVKAAHHMNAIRASGYIAEALRGCKPISHNPETIGK